MYDTSVRVPSARFRERELLVHELLEDVNLYDVWVVVLPGGSPGTTLRDVPSFVPPAAARDMSWIVRGLLRLRKSLGRQFSWDTEYAEEDAESYAGRLSDLARARSSTPPGSPGPGPFRVIYEFERESLLEAHNATVHAFLSTSLEGVSGGYRLWLAIYVKPVGRWTAWYMALIDPFRRVIIYPALIRRIGREWTELTRRSEI